MERPVVAISLGDPAGIGPEIVARVLADSAIYEVCRPLVVGDPDVLGRAISQLGLPLQARALANPAAAEFAFGVAEVVVPSDLKLGPVTPGRLDPANGEAAAACLRQCYLLARDGLVGAVAAAPMNKGAFHQAGYDYFDELEYLAEYTKTPDATMLGAIDDRLWTTAVTAHLPFRTIAEELTVERIVTSAQRLAGALQRVQGKAPRLAVAALNVHGGEGGLFGREEIDVIEPAVEAARAAGLDVTGPCPADTVFVRARRGDFDGVVCMYHDQANIARKLLATMRGATVYLGLPVPCVTTAHGTGFDIVGRGIANPGSLADAVRIAARLAT
jgi:4-hydroxythreonine-4-phosphate dehydrogenase